jgi:site-specific recombinase XerD
VNNTLGGFDMATKWIKTGYKGVRFREHKVRKHGVRKDRYFSIYYQLNGKQREEGIGWSSERWTAKGASIVLNELKKNHLTGDGPQSLKEKREIENAKRDEARAEKLQKEKENITFSQYFTESYFPISKTNKKPESYRKETEHFKNWIEPVIGHLPLSKIFPLNLEKLKKKMLDAGRSPRTIQYVFATFRQVWNMARRDGFVHSESPTKQVKLPKIDNKRIRFLTHNEAEQLLDNLSVRSMQLYNLALLSLNCGLRADEIFSLKWECVDIEKGLIFVKDSKGGSRTAFMTNKVIAMFSGFRKSVPSDYIFTDRKGNKIKSVSNAFDRAVRDLGLNEGIEDRRQKVVFHSLRHSYASNLVENGTDLYVVKKLMGHSTLAITERYAHVGQNKLKAAVRRLEKGMESNKGDKIIKLQEEIF